MIDYTSRNYDLMNNFRNKYISQFRKGLVELEWAPTNIDNLRKEEILNGLSMMGFWHKNTEGRLIELKELTEKLNQDIQEYLKIK